MIGKLDVPLESLANRSTYFSINYFTMAPNRLRGGAGDNEAQAGRSQNPQNLSVTLNLGGSRRRTPVPRDYNEFLRDVVTHVQDLGDRRLRTRTYDVENREPNPDYNIEVNFTNTGPGQRVGTFDPVSLLEVLYDPSCQDNRLENAANPQPQQELPNIYNNPEDSELNRRVRGPHVSARLGRAMDGIVRSRRIEAARRGTPLPPRQSLRPTAPQQQAQCSNAPNPSLRPTPPQQQAQCSNAPNRSLLRTEPQQQRQSSNRTVCPTAQPQGNAMNRTFTVNREPPQEEPQGNALNRTFTVNREPQQEEPLQVDAGNRICFPEGRGGDQPIAGDEYEGPRTYEEQFGESIAPYCVIPSPFDLPFVDFFARIPNLIREAYRRFFAGETQQPCAQPETDANQNYRQMYQDFRQQQDQHVYRGETVPWGMDWSDAEGAEGYEEFRQAQQQHVQQPRRQSAVPWGMDWSGNEDLECL